MQAGCFTYRKTIQGDKTFKPEPDVHPLKSRPYPESMCSCSTRRNIGNVRHQFRRVLTADGPVNCSRSHPFFGRS